MMEIICDLFLNRCGRVQIFVRKVIDEICQRMAYAWKPYFSAFSSHFTFLDFLWGTPNFSAFRNMIKNWILMHLRTTVIENARTFGFRTNSGSTEILVCHVIGVSNRKWGNVKWLENALKFWHQHSQLNDLTDVYHVLRIP